MSSKKNWALDFYNLALAFNHTKPQTSSRDECQPTLIEWVQWRRDVLAVADVLEASRKKFDRPRFLEVSGYTPKQETILQEVQ